MFRTSLTPIRKLGDLPYLGGAGNLAPSVARIERREVGAPGDFGALNDDELERALVERAHFSAAYPFRHPALNQAVLCKFSNDARPCRVEPLRV